MRDVAVLGVGMHRFGAYYGEKSNAEMSLVALSLELAILYVTAHHVARIVLSIGCARLFYGPVSRRW